MVTKYWAGIALAKNEDHDECWKRYAPGCPDLACYHFEVSHDLSEVRIANASEGKAANGIWTLAEIARFGHSWKITAGVAARMRAAIRRHESTHEKTPAQR